MNGYQSCAQWILDQNLTDNIKVLDFGCGAGEIVQELRNQEIESYGCDVFYDGGSLLNIVNSNFMEENIIKVMDNGIIPFEDNSFDFVTNKFVMEHVEDLDKALSEINRVMKPGGTVFSVFPDKGVLYEGHCGLPFLHWFPKKSTFRIYYASFLRALGLGFFKNNKTIKQWSLDFCHWLDLWTHYRTQNEISRSYGEYFLNLTHIEEYWCKVRLGKNSWLMSWMPVFLQRLIVRKISCIAFTASKPL